MDYIEELKKLRSELLNMENTYQKAPFYKILTYKSALYDFVEKEYQKFYDDVVNTIPNAPITSNEWESLEVDRKFKLRTMVDLSSLNELDKRKVLALNRNPKENMDKIREICKHANTINEMAKLYSNKKIESKDEI